MTFRSVVVDGHELPLGTRIGRGGEGEVYLLGPDNARAVKIYNPHLRKERERKVRALTAAKLAIEAQSVAFPLAVAETRDRAFVGFVMNLVKDYKPLHELYAPGARKQHFPQANYRFLTRAAANISKAIAVVHRKGCVVGDINHSGILVSQKALVCLIDADSFQFERDGETFGCKVGVPEYTPPELQGKRLDTVTRTIQHDSFGLAVVIFQLLFMGRHPFVGKIRSGEMPPLHEAIRDHRYVYSDLRDVGMDQPPGTPDVYDFFPSLAEKFDRAFSPTPTVARPSPEEWVRVLNDLESQLVECVENRLHHIPKSASDCAWCDLERTLLTTIFLPYVPNATLADQFVPDAGGFNLQQIWAAIERQSFPSEESLLPHFQIPVGSPSEAAKNARAPKAFVPWPQIIAGMISVAGFFFVSEAFVVWIGIALWALFSQRTIAQLHDHEPFRARYVAAANLWQRALVERLKRSGAEDFRRLRGELGAARLAYKDLGTQERRELDAYKGRRREHQLTIFLSSFSIRKAGLKGIGPAKEAALASFGIDTAADVSLERLLMVPGFGPVHSQSLVSWRAKLTGRFVYNESPNSSDRAELQKIRSQIESKAVNLRRQLVNGANKLQSICQRAQQMAALDDPALVRIKIELEAACCDLDFLGIPLPQISAQRVSQVRPHAVAAPPPSSGTSPLCPRCSSTMIRRVARKGSRAGKPFWGCGRYPSCKGTRNI
jgi:DNA-binding helix-hairpin-helix protein with protein kinase domain